MGLMTLWSCRGEDTVSERPELAWVSSEIVSATPERDSLVLLQFRYADGNGDLGLEPRDSLYPFAYGDPFFYNFQVRYWHCIDGRWIAPLNPLSPADTLVLSERLPNLTPSGKHKGISGDLTLRIPAKPYGYAGDSVRYECRLVDRALNTSPWVLTETLFLQVR